MIPDAAVGSIALIFSWLMVYGWGNYPTHVGLSC